MKNINISNNKKSPWISKTMQTLQNLKKRKVWDIKLSNIVKLDKEMKSIWNIIDDYKDNIISKDDFKTQFIISEQIVWKIIMDNYEDKYWNVPDVEIWVNKLPTTNTIKYNIGFKTSEVEQKIEGFNSINEVLDRINYLYA